MTPTRGLTGTEPRSLPGGVRGSGPAGATLTENIERASFALIPQR